VLTLWMASDMRTPEEEPVVSVMRAGVEGVVRAGDDGAPAARGSGMVPEAGAVEDMATEAGAQDQRTRHTM
jgi:hypothetical protein